MRLLRLVQTIRSQLVTVGVVFFVWSCAGTSPDVAQLFKRYAEASASHDLETLEALTADKIVWQLGPYRLEGKKAALGPNAYDRGMGTTLIFRDIRFDGAVVEFELVERSELIQAIGMTELRHYVRFTFENGLVVRKEPSPREPPAEYSMAEFSRRMVPLSTPD